MSHVEDFPTLSPYLVVKNGAKALEYYQKAFGARVIERHDAEDGKILHAQLQIGNSILMLSDEFPEPQGCGMAAPASSKASVALHLHLDDVDSTFNKALQAGAKVIIPLEDMYWGDRYGQLEDPFGHRWSLATPIAKIQKKEQHSHKGCCGGHH